MPTLPEPGRYGVVKTPGLVAWLIRKATRSWADHAFIVVANSMVVEAAARGVRVAPLAQYDGMQVAFNSAEPMTLLQRDAVVTKAESMVGMEYSYADLGAQGLAVLGLGWRWLFRLISWDRGATVCSQLAATCGITAGLDWMCGRDLADEVTPADLAARPGVEPWTGPLACPPRPTARS